MPHQISIGYTWKSLLSILHFPRESSRPNLIAKGPLQIDTSIAEYYLIDMNESDVSLNTYAVFTEAMQLALHTGRLVLARLTP